MLEPHWTLALESHGSAIDSNTTHGGHVALVCMPWGAIETPSDRHRPSQTLRAGRGLHTGTPLPERPLRPAHRPGALRADCPRRLSPHRMVLLASAVRPGRQRRTEQRLGPDQYGSRRAVALVQQLQRRRRTAPRRSASSLATIDVPEFLDECFASVDWSKYLVAGFTTTFAQSLATLSLARRIKHAHPHVQIVLGGANVDSEMGVEVDARLRLDRLRRARRGRIQLPGAAANIAAGRPDDRVPGVSHRRSAAKCCATISRRRRWPR